MKYGRIIAILSTVLAFWLLSVLKLIELADLIVYDYFVEISGSVLPQPEPKVAVFYTDPNTAERKDGYWGNVLEQAQQFGSKQVHFTFFPPSEDRKFYNLAAGGNVLFPRELISDPFNPERKILKPPPPGIGIRPEDCVLAEAPAHHGIFREHLRFVKSGNRTYPTFETLAAKDQHKNPRILINFLGGNDRIPHMVTERILQGGLVEEVIRDKHCIIGINSGSQSFGLHTPVNRSGMGTDRYIFHAFALDTQLQNREIDFSNESVKLLFLFLTAILSFLFYQRVEPRHYTLSTLGIIIAWGIVASLILNLAYIWFPVFEMIAVQLFMLYFVSREKAQARDLQVRRMLLDLSVNVQERLVQSDWLDSPEYWGHVIAMLSQMLDLKKTIFLERVYGDHRVREVEALNCNLDDIYEKRRDYQREPYLSALKKGGPVYVTERQYFKEIDDGDQTWLIPLLFEGEVEGFWALIVEGKKVEAEPMFETHLRTFGLQVGEMIYHRHQKQLREQAQNKTFMRYLRVDTGIRAYRSLQQSLGLIERRVSVLEHILEGLSTATAYYGVFGRPLHINKKMSEILKKLQLRGFELTLKDFLIKVAGVDSERAHSYIRMVMMERQTVYLPVAASEKGSFMLHLRPLVGDPEEQDETEMIPFQVEGMLLELIDLTEIEGSAKQKEQLFEKIQEELGEQYNKLLQAMSGFSSDHKDDPRSELQKMLQESRDMLRQSREALAQDVTRGGGNCIPVKPSASIEAAVRDIQETSDERNINISYSPEQEDSLCLAVPGDLTDSLKAILSYLIDDAAEETTIKISTTHRKDRCLIMTENEGFGMPDERLQQALFGDEEDPSAEIRILRRLIPGIRNWGGNLSCESRMGMGTRFRIELRLFSASS